MVKKIANTSTSNLPKASILLKCMGDLVPGEISLKYPLA